MKVYGRIASAHKVEKWNGSMDGTPPVGVDEYVDPTQSTPKGRFVLRADSIRPYGVWQDCGGKAADGSTASRPLQGRVPFTQPRCSVTFGRILSAPTTAAAKPPTGRLLVDPY